MNLPIQWDPPYRDKRFSFETPVTNAWCIFGFRTDGTVDISDGTNDIFTGVPLDKAERICQARNKFVNELVEIVNEGAEWNTQG